MKEIIVKEYTVYDEKEVELLYKSVGWSVYVNHPKKLKLAYENSLYILGAFKEGKLIGIIRVVGDGVSIVYIQDLLVHADYHRQGIGTLLMRAILEKYQEVRQKVLLTDDLPSQKAFYQSMGLTPIQETKGICFVKYTV